MKSVLKSYVPLFVWLILALYALLAPPAHASESAMDLQLRTAKALLDAGRWADVARIKLPPPDAPVWVGAREAESDLLYARGVGAARAGYRPMAWYAIERLEDVHQRALAEANAPGAERAAALAALLRRELD